MLFDDQADGEDLDDAIDDVSERERGESVKEGGEGREGRREREKESEGGREEGGRAEGWVGSKDERGGVRECGRKRVIKYSTSSADLNSIFVVPCPSCVSY